MRNPVVLGVLVVLILVVAGCNPFLDHLTHTRGPSPYGAEIVHPASAPPPIPARDLAPS
jgi:hypothetical protein